MTGAVLTDPLEWEDGGENTITAYTPFGNYHVEKVNSVTWRWKYCFDEYYDEDQGTVITQEEAKHYCQQDWDKRIKPILERWVKAHG